MGVPSSQVELLAAITKTFDQLEADLDRVPAHLVRQRTLPGHVADTTMSVADLVAYLIGWNEQVLTWHERRTVGLPDEFPARGIRWNELGLLAQRYYAEHESQPWESLHNQLTDAHGRIVALVESLSDDELYGQAWYGKWGLGRMISLNTSSPYANARKRLRAWLRTS